MIQEGSVEELVLMSLARHVVSADYYATSQIYQWLQEGYGDRVAWMSLKSLGRMLKKLDFRSRHYDGRSQYFIDPYAKILSESREKMQAYREELEELRKPLEKEDRKST